MALNQEGDIHPVCMHISELIGAKQGDEMKKTREKFDFTDGYRYTECMSTGRTQPHAGYRTNIVIHQRAKCGVKRSVLTDYIEQ